MMHQRGLRELHYAVGGIELAGAQGIAHIGGDLVSVELFARDQIETATWWPWCCQVAPCRQASLSTHRPTGTTKPPALGTGMKSWGRIEGLSVNTSRRGVRSRRLKTLRFLWPGLTLQQRSSSRTTRCPTAAATASGPMHSSPGKLASTRCGRTSTRLSTSPW
jgi:hypothetical protein